MHRVECDGDPEVDPYGEIHMTVIDQHKLASIKGEVIAWREVREGWGYGEIRTRTDGDVAITGKLHMARVGDTVECDGRWSDSERYGKQFKITRCTVAVPDTNEGIVAWLSATLPDVGETRARALVDTFGAELWDVIEHTPEQLRAINGITEARKNAIVTAYHAHRADRDNMIKLRGWGLTDGQIAKCLQTWGTVAEVVDLVHANPYQLIDHVYGFGFVRADKVASKAGIAHDSPARIRAGIEHVLAEAAAAGHCYVAGAALQKMASKLLGVSPEQVAAGIIEAARTGRIARRGWRIYPIKLDDAEAQCAARLADMLSYVPPAGARDGATVISLAERRAAAGKS